ncbi:MAG TPA: PqqD family protein [Gemmatimonadaceae bacterium]|nr:PqqD family protein [Gemmatimonadaceae bacterium]
MAHANPLPRPAPEVMCQCFDDGAVLFSTRTEVYYGLNLVGTTVWDLLPDAPSLDALCEEVRRRHPGAGIAEVRRDISALLDDLLAEGLLERNGSAEAPSSSISG